MRIIPKIWAWLSRAPERTPTPPLNSVECTAVTQLEREVRLARREGMEPAAFRDALTAMATDYPVTIDEVIDLVDEHGFDGAIQELERP